jgi:hypothetical protein
MQTARVIIAHQTKFADPIIVRAGEEVTLGRRDVNNPGWIWCTSRHGKSGWAPESWIRIGSDTAILLRDYSAAELDVNIGDELTVDFEESGWLWCATSDGRSGWIPDNCIEQVS